MKSKKAQLIGFGVMGAMYLFLILAIILAVWFVFRKLDFGWVGTLFSFWQKYWIWITLSIFALTPVGQGIIKFVLGKIGVKV